MCTSSPKTYSTPPVAHFSTPSAYDFPQWGRASFKTTPKQVEPPFSAQDSFPSNNQSKMLCGLCYVVKHNIYNSPYYQTFIGKILTNILDEMEKEEKQAHNKCECVTLVWHHNIIQPLCGFEIRLKLVLDHFINICWVDQIQSDHGNLSRHWVTWHYSVVCFLVHVAPRIISHDAIASSCSVWMWASYDIQANIHGGHTNKRLLLHDVMKYKQPCGYGI